MKVNYNKDHDAQDGKFIDADGQPSSGGGLKKAVIAALAVGGAAGGFFLGRAAGALANWLRHSTQAALGPDDLSNVLRMAAIVGADKMGVSKTATGALLPGGTAASLVGGAAGAYAGAKGGAALGRKVTSNSGVDAAELASLVKAVREAKSPEEGKEALMALHRKYGGNKQAIAALEAISSEAKREEGIKAHRCGEGIHKNPYEPKSNEAAHWNAGWRASNSR